MVPYGTMTMKPVSTAEWRQVVCLACLHVGRDGARLDPSRRPSEFGKAPAINVPCIDGGNCAVPSEFACNHPLSGRVLIKYVLGMRAPQTLFVGAAHYERVQIIDTR